MTTADMSLVAKESILVEKLKKRVPAQFFCPTLYIHPTSYILHVSSITTIYSSISEPV